MDTQTQLYFKGPGGETVTTFKRQTIFVGHKSAGIHMNAPSHGGFDIILKEQFYVLRVILQ